MSRRQVLTEGVSNRGSTRSPRATMRRTSAPSSTCWRPRGPSWSGARPRRRQCRTHARSPPRDPRPPWSGSGPGGLDRSAYCGISIWRSPRPRTQGMDVDRRQGACAPRHVAKPGVAHAPGAVREHRRAAVQRSGGTRDGEPVRITPGQQCSVQRCCFLPIVTWAARAALSSCAPAQGVSWCTTSMPMHCRG